jgi:Na+/H+-dicarboxylate symporter
MGRTATNVIGNSIATSVVAKWEGQLGEQIADEAPGGSPPHGATA